MTGKRYDTCPNCGGCVDTRSEEEKREAEAQLEKERAERARIEQERYERQKRLEEFFPDTHALVEAMRWDWGDTSIEERERLEDTMLLELLNFYEDWDLREEYDSTVADLRSLIADLPRCIRCQKPATKRSGSQFDTGLYCDDHGGSGFENDLPYAAVVRRS